MRQAPGQVRPARSTIRWPRTRSLASCPPRGSPAPGPAAHQSACCRPQREAAQGWPVGSEPAARAAPLLGRTDQGADDPIRVPRGGPNAPLSASIRARAGAARNLHISQYLAGSATGRFRCPGRRRRRCSGAGGVPSTTPALGGALLGVYQVQALCFHVGDERRQPVAQVPVQYFRHRIEHPRQLRCPPGASVRAFRALAWQPAPPRAGRPAARSSLPPFGLSGPVGVKPAARAAPLLGRTDQAPAR